jgi:hypothetical protein
MTLRKDKDLTIFDLITRILVDNSKKDKKA